MSNVGYRVGGEEIVGTAVGLYVGMVVGTSVGRVVGVPVGRVGAKVGSSVGLKVGEIVGSSVGESEAGIQPRLFGSNWYPYGQTISNFECSMQIVPSLENPAGHTKG